MGSSLLLGIGENLGSGSSLELLLLSPVLALVEVSPCLTDTAQCAHSWWSPPMERAWPWVPLVFALCRAQSQENH